MIRSAEIRNFRGFKAAELDGLAGINIVVGDNGAGKTALLEALFLAVVTSPDVAGRFRAWRGADNPTGTGTPQEIYDGIFLDLFHKFKRDCVPSVTVHGNAEDSRSLRIFYDKEEPALLPFGEVGQAPPTTLSGYTPVSFEWKDADGVTSKVTPRLLSGGLSFGQAGPLSRDPSFLAARTQFPTSQNARWFSDLSKWGREKRFVSNVQAQFADIQSLSVEVDIGNPVIFVKFPWLERKMPIYLASDGLNKLVTILLHIAHSEQTAVFVDEIENGFHFSRHVQLWQQLLAFSKEYETQLFLATHSWEFLKAGAPTIAEFQSDFSLVQVFQEKGSSKVKVARGKDVAAAIEADIEIRR